MKIVFIILILLAGVVIIFLLVALFMQKKYSIKSEVLINKPTREVFDYVKKLKNQEKYSKWVMSDPNVQLLYKGTDGTLGFTASWKSDMKNVGVGEQEIIDIEDGKRYDVEIRFDKPFKGVSHAFTITGAVADNKTKVITTFETETPYPMNVMIPIIKKTLKKDLDENAENLKRILES